MKIGIIGLGVVGGSLKRWFQYNTDHDVVALDPPKQIIESFSGVDAVFICVPVPHGGADHPNTQDESILSSAIATAKSFTPNVFIRSSVLPGVADKYSCIACPEFLTARRAYEDMKTLPIIIGRGSMEQVQMYRQIFPMKELLIMRNYEAELAKFTHNCFGAMKVTYFNGIKRIAEKAQVSYERTLAGALMTGFIGPEHTQVPGPDGLHGYGGMCFPENIAAMIKFCAAEGHRPHQALLEDVLTLNEIYRDKPGGAR